MDPVSSYNMAIAPAFYGTQVDIYIPIKAYSPHLHITRGQLLRSGLLYFAA